jgi:hypothetical protein
VYGGDSHLYTHEKKGHNVNEGCARDQSLAWLDAPRGKIWNVLRDGEVCVDLEGRMLERDECL